MPKLIVINRYFHPDLSATSQMLSDLAFALAAKGWAIEIVTSRQLYQSPDVRLPARETIDGVGVRRVWTSRFGRHRLLGRAIDYATFYLSAAWAVLAVARRGDVVVAKTDPPLLSLVAAPVAALRRAHLVNWLQDVYPEVAEALGVGRGALVRRLYGWLRALRNRTLNSAAINVVLGERMSEALVGEGVPAARIRIIPNWADGDAIVAVPKATNPLRREWGLTDSFVVGYSGNLGRAHEFETLLAAISVVERSASDPSRPPVRWLIVGGGALQAEFEAEIARRGLRSVILKPYQPRERLGESLSAADVHLVSLRPSMEGLIVPSKIYGVLAAGRPAIFIGHHDGEVARLIARAGCGVTVAEGDGAALAAAVLAYASDPDRLLREGSAARQAFAGGYDRRIAADAWDRMLREILARGP